jgi:hypothetical protein
MQAPGRMVGAATAANGSQISGSGMRVSLVAGILPSGAYAPSPAHHMRALRLPALTRGAPLMVRGAGDNQLGVASRSMAGQVWLGPTTPSMVSAKNRCTSLTAAMVTGP